MSEAYFSKLYPTREDWILRYFGSDNINGTLHCNFIVDKFSVSEFISSFSLLLKGIFYKTLKSIICKRVKWSIFILSAFRQLLLLIICSNNQKEKNCNLQHNTNFMDNKKFQLYFILSIFFSNVLDNVRDMYFLQLKC